MKKKLRIFFNASVILAGLHSPKGGSARTLKWSKEGLVDGYISEIVLDEAKRHAEKIKITPKKLENRVLKLVKVAQAPKKVSAKYEKIVKDIGDIHLFTSAEKLKVNYLVSLDKKHVLSLTDKVWGFKIASPGELIEKLEEKM